ncbi:MAG: hypothetical protein WC479_07755 [Candidatus Izemoplasmatales bacterium]|jgi:Skp family chaperone for outer membrane proteins
MKVKLSISSVNLLKGVLSFTGEKEIDQRGNEIASPRRMNGEESSQRRHYIKATEEEVKKVQEEINAIEKTHRELVEKLREDFKKESPKKKTETEEDYEKKLNIELSKNKELIEAVKAANKKIEDLNKTEIEFEVTDKTFEVMKKFFKEFGDKVGFGVADDEQVEELTNVLK